MSKPPEHQDHTHQNPYTYKCHVDDDTHSRVYTKILPEDMPEEELPNTVLQNSKRRHGGRGSCNRMHGEELYTNLQQERHQECKKITEKGPSISYVKWQQEKQLHGKGPVSLDGESHLEDEIHPREPVNNGPEPVTDGGRSTPAQSQRIMAREEKSRAHTYGGDGRSGIMQSRKSYVRDAQHINKKNEEMDNHFSSPRSQNPVSR